jgi:hypothetical protein
MPPTRDAPISDPPPLFLLLGVMLPESPSPLEVQSILPNAVRLCPAPVYCPLPVSEPARAARVTASNTTKNRQYDDISRRRLRTPDSFPCTAPRPPSSRTHRIREDFPIAERPGGFPICFTAARDSVSAAASSNSRFQRNSVLKPLRVFHQSEHRVFAVREATVTKMRKTMVSQGLRKR